MITKINVPEQALSARIIRVSPGRINSWHKKIYAL